jgi:hypothetical protein
VLVKQFAAKQEADDDEDKWLIGAGSLVPEWGPGAALDEGAGDGVAWRPAARVDGRLRAPTR